MSDPNKYGEYEPTIGIECHVQLRTKTKIFSAVSNDARDAEPNTLVSPICFGMPGVLPVLNEHVVELAVKAGLVLNAEIANFSKFDRKHYFYPDLPKGYQITQFDQPIVGQGKIEVPLGDDSFNVRITRAHLEEDAGKSIHPGVKDYSLVDLNRAGTPLLEIVSEPDMHSPAEARAFAQELYYLMKFADVSDVDLYQGNMRFDINTSVAKVGSKELGTRSEVKNLNSFRSVEKAAEYEIKRQIDLLKKGQQIVQETRGWDDSKMRTESQRGKEEAHDYRYFPEPDLPPVELSDDQINDLKSQLPHMPNGDDLLTPGNIRKSLSDIGIDKKSVEALLSRSGELGNDYISLIFKLIETSAEAGKFTAKFIVNDYFAISSPNEGSDSYLPNSVQLASTYELVSTDELNSTNAKKLLVELLRSESDDVAKIAQDNSLLQKSDSSEIEMIVDKVIAAEPQAAEDVKKGETKVIGYLVGQVMKESKGQANPQIAQQIIRKKLGQ